MNTKKRKCLCQCKEKNCSRVFEFNDKQLVKSNHVIRFVCPFCGHSFEIISLVNKQDEKFLDRYYKYSE